DVAEECPIGGEARHCLPEHPAPRAINPTDAVLCVVRLACSLRSSCLPLAALLLVRIDNLPPGAAVHFVGGESGELQRPLVEKGDLVLRVGHPNVDRHMVCHRTESLFALAQIHVHTLALLDQCCQQQQRHGDGNEELLECEYVGGRCPHGELPGSTTSIVDGGDAGDTQQRAA